MADYCRLRITYYRRSNGNDGSGELLSAYAHELEQSSQWQEANKVRNIMDDADHWFIKRDTAL